MKSQKFITAENLPDLADAFARSVTPALETGAAADVKISLIGEPGVGKSYISAKLSEGVLGPDALAQVQAIPRDNMHDLILWSLREGGGRQVLQYDEASSRFVDPDYHDFVRRQLGFYPLPAREKPGITFAEHPEADTEESSDMVIRVALSEQQVRDMLKLREMLLADDRDRVIAVKRDIAAVAAQGCLLEMSFQGTRLRPAPLIDFFGPPAVGAELPAAPSEGSRDEPGYEP